MAEEEVEHLAVEFMAVEVFVFDVGAAAVDDAEGAAEVPQGPAEVEFAEDVKFVFQPGKGDVVGRAVVGTELADEQGLTASIEHGAPRGGEQLTYPLLVVGDAVGFVRPRELVGREPHAIVEHPRGVVMGDKHGLVSAPALHDALHIGNLQQRLATPLQAVDHDDAAGIGVTDSLDKTAHDALVVGGGKVGHLVEEIETEVARADLGVALGQHAPLIGTALESAFAGEEVLGLGRGIDAVAGSAVEIEADVDVVLTPPLHAAVDVAQHLLVHDVVVAGAAPAPVGDGDADEVEPPLVHPLELLLAEGFRVVAIEVVEEVETMPARSHALQVNGGRGQGRHNQDNEEREKRMTAIHKNEK